MVLVVVSRSGSWEPSSAKPRARELSVPSWKVREAADTAIAAELEKGQNLKVKN